LDNCEHLVGALTSALDCMLSTEPMLHILTTSQVPLDLDGEATHVLEPLTIAESVVLFAQRAQQCSRSFQLDDDSTVVESICRSLDGLPLAIELAASRTKALSVHEIARRLEDRFTLLSDPVSHGSPRQRTLHAAIAWSYDLLFPDDQRGLWAVSSFPGGAPLAAAEHVLAALGVPADALMDVFTRLADRSLVAVEVDPDGAVRYRLLDSVREFSIDRLRTSGLTDTALGACASWFADAATDVAQGVRGHEQARHLSFVRTEQVNIDAAVTWSLDHDPLLALRIVTGLGWAWAVLGGNSDAAQRVRAAVASARAVAQTSDVTAALLLAGWLEASGGDLEVATADLDEAMRLGDPLARSTGTLYLAFIRSQQGRAEGALTLLAQCRPHFHDLGRTWEEGATWLLSAWAEIALGRTDRGKAACDEALRLLRPLGDQWALNHAEGMLGALAEAEQRFAGCDGAPAAGCRRNAPARIRLGRGPPPRQSGLGTAAGPGQPGSDHRSNAPFTPPTTPAISVPPRWPALGSRWS
jgi:predicted ATPase